MPKRSALLVAVLAALVGCGQILGIDDVVATQVDAPLPIDAPPADVDATAAPGLEVTWTLQEGQGVGMCPPGATVAALYVCPGTCPGTATPRVETLACTTTGTFTVGGPDHPEQALEPGLYTAWVRLTDGAGTARFAESDREPVAIQGGTVQRLAFSFQSVLGRLEVSWRLVGAQSGAMLGCADVEGESGVSIIVTFANTQFEESIVDCEPGTGRGPLVPLGTHTVALTLLRGQNSVGEAQAAPITVTYGNELVSLGQRTIRVDGR